MTYDYDVQNTPRQDIGQADAMSRLRFKDDENDLVAVAMATIEKLVVYSEKLRKEMQSNEFTKRMMKRVRSGIWKNCTKRSVSNALTVQNDLIYNGSRVFITDTCRKQVIGNFHIHQGVNALWNLCLMAVHGQRYPRICQKLSQMQQTPTKTDWFYRQMGQLTGSFPVHEPINVERGQMSPNYLFSVWNTIYGCVR